MITRVRFVFVSGLFFLLILFPGTLIAKSFPTPGRQADSSLLGIPMRVDPEASDLKNINITIDGPRRLKLTVGTDDWDIRWFRVNPGTYHINDMNTDSAIDVPPGVIMVSPIRVVLTDSGTDDSLVIRLEPTDEEDRQKAALRLAQFFDFPEWHGRGYIGFGSLRPTVEHEQELFEATLVSDPPGAEIYLDDQLVGVSPLTLTLAGGKYKLFFRSENREDVTRYVRLEGDADILVELPPAIEAPSERETYRTVIGPFLPKGEIDEQINMLFVDTLEIVLEDDPRLSLVRSEVPWERMGDLSIPDFSLLEETGADLVVTGTFLKQGNQLVVQANLYDIQAESVKSGIFWTGEVGLSIFEAMDVIAEKFMEEVDRVLPDAGRVLITRSEVVYGALSDKEQGISRKQLINRRWQDYPDSFNIQVGIGGVMQEGLVPMSMTPPISVFFDWSRDLSSLWQAGAGGNVHINLDRSFSGETTAPFVDLEAYGGARIMFRTSRTDMSFGLSGTIRFSPQFTDEGSTYGSFLSVGLPVDIRFNYYFTDTIERNPVYFITNISVSFVGYRFDLSGNKQHGFVNMSGLITFGVGMRL